MKDMSMNERSELPLPLCRFRASNMKRATLSIETLGTGTGTAKKCFSRTASSQRSRRPEPQGVTRDQLLAVFVQIDACTVVIETCTSSFYCIR